MLLVFGGPTASMVAATPGSIENRNQHPWEYKEGIGGPAAAMVATAHGSSQNAEHTASPPSC